MKKGCRRRKNAEGLRVTAWVVCVSILAVFLSGELCKKQVLAGEEQESILLITREESEGEVPDSEKEEVQQNSREEMKSISEAEESELEDLPTKDLGLEDFASEESELVQPFSEESELAQPCSEESELIQPFSEESELVQPFSEPSAPSVGEITENTVWTAGQLQEGGTITIPSGITLTLTGKVSINGNTLINGGGSIKREAGGYLSLGRSKVLTMEKIEIDGGAIAAAQSVISGQRNSQVNLTGCEFHDCVTRTSNGAALFMENGIIKMEQCSFSNCKTEAGKGGAVYINEGSAELEKCAFTQCSAEADGGALYFERANSKLINCTFDQCSAKNGGAAYFYYKTAELTECTFTGCSAASDGGAIKADYGTVIIENGKVENCSAKRAGGGIYARECMAVTINGGNYSQNKTEGETGTGKGGGCIMNHASKLYLNGGTFSGNTSNNRGGFLYNGGNQGTATYINGGTFSGNTCTNTAENLGLEGSGAIFCSSNITNPNTVLQLSGTETFTGGEKGTDGIYLDFSHDLPRCLQIASELKNPLKVYLNSDAAARYVVAKGTASYQLTEGDKAKIEFIDLGSSGKTWHVLQDRTNNQIVLSEFDLNQKFRITYDSNGAEGKVEDPKEYTILESVTLKPADALRYKGMYFCEWNTNKDGNGVGRKPGEVLSYLSENITLYAKFKKTPVATFYSGESNEGEILPAQDMNPDTGIGKAETPQLKELKGWEAQGWTKDQNEVISLGEVTAGNKVNISEDISYYGVYRKQITLSYDANGGDGVLPGNTFWAYANVRKGKTAYRFLEQQVASKITRSDGYRFLNWNTKKDGSGESYPADSIHEFRDSVTLYAQWTIEPTADYTVEHYKQDLTGEGYTIAYTEILTGETGTTAEALAKSYTGFAENISHPQRKANGEITADGALILKLYYDRNSYEVKFDFNGGNGEEPETQLLRYGSLLQEPKAPVRDGYVFLGWYKEKEVNEDSRWEFDRTVEENISVPAVILYAGWSASQTTAEYQVEHYQQDLAGDGYTIADTEQCSGSVGTAVTAEPQTYTGFTEHTSHPQRKANGEIAADGSLVLKLYYDRDSYEIKFDVNGGTQKPPQNQILRWGACLEEPEAPVRAGYSFQGWYQEKEGTEENQWDFVKPVEENTAARAVTLYAKWVDDIAPVLGEASFQTSCSHFPEWAISRQNMVITVPITEEGSGVKAAEYWLVPEKDAGDAFSEQAEFPRYQAAVETENGQLAAKITITEDFKGEVFISCTDHAGNSSKETALTPKNGGVIVENHPPQIQFSSEEGQLSQTFSGDVTVNVTVDDGETGTESSITGGLAQVSCQIDQGEEQMFFSEEFASQILPSCQFQVKISGQGEHFLRVTAEDHAGNQTVKQVQIMIGGSDSTEKNDSDIPNNDSQEPEEKEEELPKPAVPDAKEKEPRKAAVSGSEEEELQKAAVSGFQEKEPQKPAVSKMEGNEPETGENSHTEWYALLFLLAGAAYLLLGRFCGQEERDI